MNVACGVVGVDWRVFWLTTAAGSASWSYVTASVGHIIGRLSVPSTSVLMDNGDELLQGDSLTALLRDPVLIAKMIFLSLLTLLPVMVKRRSTIIDTADDKVVVTVEAIPLVDPMAKESSYARLSPAFDLLNFGRMTVRTGTKAVRGGMRGLTSGLGRVVNGLSGR